MDVWRRDFSPLPLMGRRLLGWRAGADFGQPHFGGAASLSVTTPTCPIASEVSPRARSRRMKAGAKPILFTLMLKPWEFQLQYRSAPGVDGILSFPFRDLFPAASGMSANDLKDLDEPSELVARG